MYALLVGKWCCLPNRGLIPFVLSVTINTWNVVQNYNLGLAKRCSSVMFIIPDNNLGMDYRPPLSRTKYSDIPASASVLQQNPRMFAVVIYFKTDNNFHFQRYWNYCFQPEPSMSPGIYHLSLPDSIPTLFWCNGFGIGSLALFKCIIPQGTGPQIGLQAAISFHYICNVLLSLKTLIRWNIHYFYRFLSVSPWFLVPNIQVEINGSTRTNPKIICAFYYAFCAILTVLLPS